MWQPGETRLLRYVWENQVWYALPVTVVEDCGDRVCVYLQTGTPCKWTLIDFDTGRFDGPKDHTWHTSNILKFFEVGSSHAVSLFWEASGGEFIGWYVDLQDRLQRVTDGLVTWDRSLDIVVAPDLTWKWKDEDHFVRIQELGWITRAEADRLRAEGEEVIDRIERNVEPFCDSWPEWKPDANWEIPGLAPNWSQLPDAGG